MELLALIKALQAQHASAEVIQAEVDAWLEDHPEASTTVQDGAITYAKLHSNLQGAVDDVGDLKSAVAYLCETGNIAVSHDITWQNGYVGTTGVINSSSLSGFAIVPLDAGETVTIGTKNTNIAIISTTPETSLSVGDSVTPVKITTSVDTFQTYEYTAESSVNVVLCVRLSDYEVSFSKKSNLVTESEISNITGLEKSIVYDGPLFSGTVDAVTGKFVATSGWSCTDYFQIPFVSGSKMKFTGTIYPGSDYGVAFYDYNKKFLMGIGASNASDWGITPSSARIQALTIVIPQNAAYIKTSVLSSSVSPSAFTFAGVTIGDIVNRVTNLEYATQFSHIKPLKLLVLGDSYSAQRRWINALMGYFGNGSNYITLAVTGATIKDQSNDRTTYPYTSRPTSSGGTNQNTISCQIAKLERLMAGVDLDEGETQIYASEDDYPNVIIIEGGQNDFRDNDSTEETYFDQFEVAVDNVYIKQTASGEASVGVASVRPSIETINRTCFAGAYRYAIEKLMGLFPDAQIFITTVSDVSYRKNYAVTKVRYKIAEQQIKCARMASVSVIDWYANGQMSVLNNTLTGSGTQTDPYIVGGPTEDTLDSLHPNDRGAAKLGQVAAKAIYSNWMDIE